MTHPTQYSVKGRLGSPGPPLGCLPSTSWEEQIHIMLKTTSPARFLLVFQSIFTTLISFHPPLSSLSEQRLTTAGSMGFCSSRTPLSPPHARRTGEACWVAGTECVCTPGEQDEHLHSSLGVNTILVPLFCILLERMWSFVHPLCHSASHGQSCLSIFLTTGFPALEWMGDPE